MEHQNWFLSTSSVSLFSLVTYAILSLHISFSQVVENYINFALYLCSHLLVTSCDGVLLVSSCIYNFYILWRQVINVVPFPFPTLVSHYLPLTLSLFVHEAFFPLWLHTFFFGCKHDFY